MERRFLSFDWDEGNLAHIAQLGITREEAEQSLLGNLLDIEAQIDENNRIGGAAPANRRDG
jgi:hypothetical protein